VVAPRVDGVILTLRLSRHSRPAAQRATEILSTLNAKLLGVVINGFGSRTGYGYEQGYGYGYAYNYAYGYGYEDTDAGDNGLNGAPVQPADKPMQAK
jgi:Mrp family chromosome partitioning ATPase